MTFVLAGLFASLMAVMLALLVGLVGLPASRPLADAEIVGVTVLVCARNEERALPDCLAALAVLDYPRERLQFVLVDDRSTDGTGALLAAFAAREPRATVVRTADRPDHGLDAKARAVAAGFAAASGEWVLICDADAAVPPTWVRHLLGGVGPEVGLVAGAVVVRADGVVSLIERVSWSFLQIFSAGVPGLGFPAFGVGPNMGIRRAVYVASGGLEAAPRQIAEDMALTVMVAKAGLRGRQYFDAATRATLVPVTTWVGLMSQQRRWMGGGTQQSRQYGLSMALVFAWGCGVAFAFAFGWLISLRVWCAALLVRALIDGLALAVQRRRLGITGVLRTLVVMEAYTVFAFVFLPLSLAFTRQVTWRGEGYVDRLVARQRA